MSSFQKGLCPVCRVHVQVKNFKRHWNYQHQRHERKRTYDEVFDTLKANISDQDKATTTPSINTFFENKKRRVSEDARLESTTTIIQENITYDDNVQSFDVSSPLLLNSDIHLRESNNNTSNDDMVVLLQIFDDIFVQLEDEKHVIRTSSITDQQDDVTSTVNSIVNMISSNITETEKLNDTDVLIPLNDLITDIINCGTIENENFNGNDNVTLFIDSIDNISNCDTSRNENISDSEVCCSSTYLPINRPPCIKVSLPGVQFITDRELKFVDQQRLLLKDNVWLPNDGVGISKPSRIWFTETRSNWLRAVCSQKKYGLLCIICAQEAKCLSRLKKSKGAFISHPFWKLLHKGLNGIKQHEESELHKQSLMRYKGKLQAENEGTITEQLNATKISTRKASWDYLRAVARSFIFVLSQEFAFMNLKDLIKLQQLNLSEPIVQWLSIANKKEMYWSGESRGDWLISVQKWLWKKQLEELKDVTYITIIADETCDISVIEQLCICLRYFIPSTGELVERIVRLCEINSQTGEAIFDVINQFLFELENELGKKLILIGQCFDGASALRCQAQGQIRARISAFAFYVHCRSHLINLSVKDTLINDFSKSHDLIHRTLVFFHESSQRLNVLKESQIVHGTSKEGSKVPSASDTRWVYHCQLADFTWTHIVSIVSALVQIHENNKDGSDTANGYAIRFVNEKFIYEVGIMKIILGHAKHFLKQTESRSITFDKFSTCLDSTIVRIKNTLLELDYDIYQEKVKDCHAVLPVTKRTVHSTRSYNPISNITNDDHINIKTNLNNYGTKLINSTLQSIDKRFGQDSRIIMDNISMFTKLNDYSDTEVLNNPLLKLYCIQIYYKHEGIDHKIYERTDEALLCFRDLEKQLPQLRVLLRSVNNDALRMQQKKNIHDEVCLLDLVKFLSTNGQYLVPEWFKLYQILTTLPIGSNECERSFSALQRIKTKLRNNLSCTALETAVKFTILKPDVTDDDLDVIVQNFCMYPGRAKARNIKIYIHKNNDDDSDDEQ